MYKYEMSEANRANAKHEALTLRLELPPTTNAGYKLHNGRMYTSSTWKDYQSDVAIQLLSHRGKYAKLPVKVNVVWYLKRDRDIDSGLKCLLDSLQNGGLFDNDRQVVDLHCVKRVSDKGGCLVTVTPVT